MGQEPSTRWLSLALVLVVLGFAAPAAAQDAAAMARARKHYKLAEAARNAGAHAEAAREYEAAYAESAKPNLLFNIALSYEDLGDRVKAIDYYGRYLATGPTGDAAGEAKVRKADLEQKLAAERASQGAARRAKGLELRRTGQPADAAVELRAAHELTLDPEVLFELGEALRAADKPVEAREAYARYLRDAPTGPRARESSELIAALDDAATATGPASGASGVAGAADTSGATAGPTDAPASIERGAAPTSDRHRLYWYTGAVLAVATGVLLDQRDTSKNGELDGADFIAPGLYALGAGFVLVGSF